MNDLISRRAAIKFANEQMVKETGAYSKGRNAALLVMKSALNNPDAIPSVDAVPLDKLCEWLSESSINIPCTSCKNFVNEYCTAIGDNSRPCPNSADEWRRAITEWMEEQQDD